MSEQFEVVQGGHSAGSRIGKREKARVCSKLKQKLSEEGEDRLKKYLLKKKRCRFLQMSVFDE
ncbi:hypothetical protein COLO4_38492 [Corchorus olitorius]|uniref:Uncharacterized protein n=1 Tax=Corchorus olitorius TaxID=93759 RepID=A0A1R3FUP5_9ROSI|nr:hypothetical protein COLO4_38492 [Corchorus olitorius]